MDTQGCQMQQLCDHLIDMKREIANLSNSAPVTSTPSNSNRANSSDINPFVTLDRADIAVTPHNNLASLLTHNLSNNTQPLMPSNPFQGSNTVNNPFVPVGTLNNPIDNHSKGFVLKPKDILMLKLSELQGVGTDNRLARFFSQVEFCVSADTDTNIAQAWQEIEIERYSIYEAPRAFVDRMKCKLSAFEMKFPKDSFPKADSLVKKKLYRGLSSTSQERLKDFLDNRIPLERFIEFVEYEYHLATISGDVTQRKVFPVKNCNSQPQPVVNSNANTTTELQDLKRQISDLSNKLKKFSKNKENNQYCAYCKVRDHKLSECPCNPPKGVCFDCHKPNCKRGSTKCPGPVENE
ncbi:uncharacterized protein LOC135206363 [Macrobrachium nipponense]|uniref:uncharacterized protein LOC135206363 n=1 Tax=Macrobrachium nipponense TaxID=159736 RepID=UPI0030C8400B